MNGPSITRPSKSPQTPFASNPVVQRAQSQWLFTSGELSHAPSILDGMPIEVERTNRAKGINFILQAGAILKIPQLTLATASLYLHRFFMRHSMVEKPGRPGLHHYAIAATSLFLATKVEESCRKMRDLVVTFCRVAQKQPNLVVDESSKEYWRWRDTILHNEDVLLEALCFDLQLEQPYRLLFDFLCYYGVQDNKNLRNAAWAFVNDSNLTTMRLQFSARAVAASALYAAAKHTDVAFPDDEYGRPWWEHLKVDIGEMKKACNQLVDAYQKNRLPANNEQGAYVVTPEDSGEEATKTRIISTTPIQRSPAISTESDAASRKRPREDQANGPADNDSQRLPKSPRLQEFSSPQAEQLAHRPPSPKRPRLNSLSNGYSRQSSNEQISKLPATDDDIQSRIDSIVNGSGSAETHDHQAPSHNHRAPLSRQNSHQHQHVPQPQHAPQHWTPPSSRPNDSHYHRHRSRSRSPHRATKTDTYIGAAGRERGMVAGSARRSPSHQASHDSNSRRGSYDASVSERQEYDLGGRRRESYGTNERRLSVGGRKDELNGSKGLESREEAEGSEEGELED